MMKTPKSLRLHLGIFGRTNVGKSSFLNTICGQNAAITSSVAGTTTDVVEKSMELLPIGPVVFLDTAGLDDQSQLSQKRIEKTKKSLNRTEVMLLITEAGVWSEYEQNIADQAKAEKLPLITIINKVDLNEPQTEFSRKVQKISDQVIVFSSKQPEKREYYLQQFKSALIKVCPEEFITPPPIIGDLLPPAGVVVMIVPIDLQAPKGRLILPQVQAIRDTLDNDAVCLVVKEREYTHVLENVLAKKPDLVVCDSQVVLKMVADTPDDVKCTTFSILFSRAKGDLNQAVAGACAIDFLKPDDPVLIAESCSHHPIEDDIGRVKIPRWLRQYTGAELDINFCSGRDFPDDIARYKLIIHCGGCMINRREMLYRAEQARSQNVPMTNYGTCISQIQGVLKRAISPFPSALITYEQTMNHNK